MDPREAQEAQQPAPPGVDELSDPEGWSRFLGSRLGTTVDVAFGRSRTYPVQVRTRRLPAGPGRSAKSVRAARGAVHFELRLHSMFATAPAEVAEAVAGWIRSGRRARGASEVLDRWIDEATAALPPRRPPAHRLQPRGDAYDLQRLAEELVAGPLSADFPARRPLPGLTWGRRARSRTRRSLRLGSFDVEADLVRLHPVLDQAGVPEWFVRYVLFHELLHAAHPPRRGADGRWIHHGPEFRRRERAYRDYARALKWQDENLPRLIRSARTGSTLRVRHSIQSLFRFDS